MMPTPSKAPSAEVIGEALALPFEPGAVIELRILETPHGVVSGYFNDFDALTQAALKMAAPRESTSPRTS